VKKEPRKDYKDGELNKLKRRVKRLEKENQRLKSENNAFEQAFKKTTKFLEDHTEDISLEDLIQASKQDKNLRKVEKEHVESLCPKCLNKLTQLPKSRVGVITVCKNCEYRKVEKND
jgi:predicted nuclease with TOPRIM domain